MKENKPNKPGGTPLDLSSNIPTKPLSKEQIKAYLYLTSGKLDSVTKVFKKKIIIKREDIIDLNRVIQEKLSNHDVEASMTSINVLFEKNKMKQFAFWQEFIEADWKIPETIESITMLWDFLVTMPNYTEPQRHTLTVKISSNQNFSAMLPILMSSDINEADEMELKNSPIICQVSFINSLISDELISIVEKWVECRKESEPITKFKKILQKKKSIIADSIYYSIPIFISLVALSILYNYSKGIINQELTTNIVLFIAYWMFISILSFFIFYKIGYKLARFTFNAIYEYGEFSIFEITNGDSNKQDEIKRKNKKYFKKYLLGSLSALIINLISAIIFYNLFS